ncbi:hypothetical protein [Methylomagnum sp.]
MPVELAVGCGKGAREPWIIITDEAAGPDTLRDYGLRFAIEAGFLDHKSGGFQWESSKLRDAGALRRLCLAMAPPRPRHGLAADRGAGAAYRPRPGTRPSRKPPDRSRWMDGLPCRYLFSKTPSIRRGSNQEVGAGTRYRGRSAPVQNRPATRAASRQTPASAMPNAK